MFCETCTDFLRTIADAHVADEPSFGLFEGSFEHHATYNAFRRALDKGCALCKKVWAQIGDEALDVDDDELAAFGMRFQWFSYPYRSRSNIDLWIDPVSGFWGPFKIFLTQVDSSEDRLLLPDYHETTNTGSDACFALANHWLKTCLSSHQDCEGPRPSASEDWTPSRLIRIKSADDLVLCLREMGSIPIGVGYATLSHCWGNIPETQRIFLTSENVNSWTREMPDLKSMKTFHQAIIACQKLGLEYIWIDSLCIFQDSQDDWRQEASLMSTVYKYSQCTITATAANDDTVGCFFDRDLDVYLPTRVEFLRDHISFLGTNKQSIPSCHILPEHSRSTLLRGRYDIRNDSNWEEYIDSGPVNQRSWVVQERLLSPRVLHFSEKELFWECAKLKASESAPFGMPDSGTIHFKALSPLQYQCQYHIEYDFEAETLSQKCQRLTYASLIWRAAVSAYTRGKLTKGSDKLIAISSIARELQPLIRCRYLAGLWETDFVFQLSWWGYKSVVPSMVYRAPSWSWASIDGEIMFANPDSSSSYSTLVEILEVVIGLVGEDEFGQVQRSHLKLLGQTIDLEFLDKEKELGRRKVLFNGKLNSATILENNANMRTKTSTNQLCCLPLHLHLSRMSSCLSGLILECVDVTNNEYRRVGLLEHSKRIPDEIGHTGKVSIEDPFISTLGDIEQTEDKSLVFKRGSADLREITII